MKLGASASVQYSLIKMSFEIVVEPGSDTPRKLFIGSLLDITSEVIPSSEVNQRLDFSTRSAREAGLS